MGYIREKGDELTDAQRRIYNRLVAMGSATPKQLIEHEDISIGKVMLHRHLKRLIQLDLIERIGNPPKVYYRFKKQTTRDPIEIALLDTPIPDTDLFDKYFGYVKNLELLEGQQAFKEWFIGKQLPNIRANKSRKLPLLEQASKALNESLAAYLELRTDLDQSKVLGSALFDGTLRYRSIHKEPVVDFVYYVDFYSLPVYGKSLLGHYIQKAKVGDKFSRVYINKVAKSLASPLENLIRMYKIDSLLWVPHSLKRPVSLMNELKSQLGRNRPEIKVMKAFPSEVIPQKSISDLGMRIENAMASNHIETPYSHLQDLKNVLIIDDAIGSNATIHAIATKIKEVNPRISVVALAPVGSYKGFDVIQDI